jgi:hypothetical protein
LKVKLSNLQIKISKRNFIFDYYAKGGSSKTVGSTVNLIVPRIQSKEIKLGIIVYNKNTQPVIGTKGWMLSVIKSIFSNIKIYFIDDSMKNIECVEKLNDNNIKTYFIDKRNNPKEQLIQILNLLN